MARIAGVDIPGKKHITIALRYIYGIGPVRAREICEKANIPQNKLADQLDEGEIRRIREVIDGNFKVEGDLRREISMHIKRLMDLGSYRGPATSKRPTRSRAAHSYQCTHTQRPTSGRFGT
jgi:small subunit ribosomal protein S13